MGEFSITHWLVIAVIGIVFFGPKRLPALGQSLGESIRGFKKALNDHHENAPPTEQSQTQASSQASSQSPRRETIIANDADTARTTTSTVKDTTHS